MVQPPEEKRMAPRHSYTFPVTYTGKVGTLAMPPQEVLFQGKIVDLSSGGFALEKHGNPFLKNRAVGAAWIPQFSVSVNAPRSAPGPAGGDNNPGLTQLYG